MSFGDGVDLAEEVVWVDRLPVRQMVDRIELHAGHRDDVGDTASQTRLARSRVADNRHAAHAIQLGRSWSDSTPDRGHVAPIDAIP